MPENNVEPVDQLVVVEPFDQGIDLSGHSIQSEEIVHESRPAEILHDIEWPKKHSKTIIIQSVVTADDKDFNKALEWLKPIHSAYCDKFAFDYLATTDKIIETSDPNFSYAWNKIPLIQQAIRSGYEYIWWIDHDCVIVDFSKNINEAFDEPGCEIMMCVHPGIPQYNLPSHFNAGCFAVHGSERTEEFFNRVWQQRYHGPTWYEQDIMNEMFQDFEWMDIVGVMSDRYNSTPNANQVEDKDVIIAAFHGVGSYNNVDARLDYMQQFAKLRNVEGQIRKWQKTWQDPLVKDEK